eukprot:scaffold621_cov39-Prasinocladus_malaysianus.AAC.2
MSALPQPRMNFFSISRAAVATICTASVSVALMYNFSNREVPGVIAGLRNRSNCVSLPSITAIL